METDCIFLRRDGNAEMVQTKQGIYHREYKGRKGETYVATAFRSFVFKMPVKVAFKMAMKGSIRLAIFVEGNAKAVSGFPPNVGELTPQQIHALAAPVVGTIVKDGMSARKASGWDMKTLALIAGACLLGGGIIGWYL